MRIKLTVLYALAAVAVALVACGGGGGGGGGVTVPTSQPTGQVTLSPTSQSTTAPVTTSGASIPFGGISNGTKNVVASALFELPPLSAPGTAQVTLTTVAPALVPAPSMRNTRGRFSLGVMNTPLAYFNLTLSQAETISETPQVEVTAAIGQTVPSGNAYLVV